MDQNKIAIISVSSDEGFGAEIVLENLLRGWHPGSSSLIICSPEGSRVLRVARKFGFDYYALPLARDTAVQNVRRVLALKRQLVGLSLVHAWAARAFEGTYLLGRLLGVPVTGTLHDHPRAAFHGVARQFVMRLSANRFARLGCVSGAVLRVCEDAGYRCPMTVLHNGLAEMPFSHKTSEKVHIGFLGMYINWKGFHIVQHWIRELDDPSIVWHLYGNVCADLVSDAEQLVREYPDHVVLEGHHQPETIFASLDILVHASTKFDSLPTVLIEAARAGIPVVAPLSGGSGEIVVPNETGFLFNLEEPREGMEQLRRLTEDQETRLHMGQAARSRFEKVFTVESMVDRYRKFWRDAM